MVGEGRALESAVSPDNLPMYCRQFRFQHRFLSGHLKPNGNEPEKHKPESSGFNPCLSVNLELGNLLYIFSPLVYMHAARTDRPDERPPNKEPP